MNERQIYDRLVRDAKARPMATPRVVIPQIVRVENRVSFAAGLSINR